ncbi:hypothetical protein [Streptomyces sp. NPDC005538]|uniref:hypothetical protein n=1 Tax=unclassified Streptomyces TaxID=2593676 RepID=UPI0033B80504
MGSDQLIQAGLDALLADVDSPSVPLLAGLARREEPDAPELFDQVVDELGLFFEPPADPTAAKWALAHWPAEQITAGSLRTRRPPSREGPAEQRAAHGGS